MAETAVDQRARRRRRRHFGAHEREGPRRRGVPDILDGRIVVECKTDEQVVARQRRMLRPPQVDVVDADCAIGPRIGELREYPDVGSDLSRDEKAELLRKAHRSILRSRLRFRDLRQSRHDHSGERRNRRKRERLLRSPVARLTYRRQRCERVAV